MSFGFVQCDLIFTDQHIFPYEPSDLETGDTLVYHSTTNVDSFYVRREKMYAPRETEDGEIRYKEQLYERYSLSIPQIDCSDSCIRFHVYIVPSEYFVGYNGKTYILDSHTQGHTIQIGKYKLNDLHKNFTLLADTVNGQNISTIYYIEKYGVIEYICTNGEVFDIDEACITKIKRRN